MDLETLPAELGEWLHENEWNLQQSSDDVPPAEGILEAGAAVAAGVGTRLLLKSMWKLARGGDPPENPADAETDWRDALLWAASVGAAIGVARVLARRGAATFRR